MACAPAPPAGPVARPAPAVVTTATKHVEPKPTYAKTSTAKLAELDDHVWPPKLDGAEWIAFERPWLHKIEGAPPIFYRTTVRPDPKRKVEVHVVAMDARQLELDMAIGKEGPWPPDEKTNGKFPRYGGKLPRTPEVAKHVVAAFNGAFRLDQNAWGMMIRRRVFAPPVKDVASLLMHDDGRLGFGTWGPDMTTPPDVRSLRQNLDPLVDDGEIDPRHRKRWGGILKAANQVGQRAKRSGICRTSGGHLLYLYGDAIEAADLGVAMKMVGCEYGIHLDMNAIHVGFVFMSFEDEQYKVGKSEVLVPNMGITAKRYIDQPNPKEFFYATLRAPYAGPDPSFVPDGFPQPEPAWLPSILASGQTTFIDSRRVRFAMTVPGTSLPPADAERVLAALDLESADGVAVDDHGRLTIDGTNTSGACTTTHGDLLIGQSGCTRAIAVRRFERAGRDEIAAGGERPRIYVLAERPPSATYRFDKDDAGALRWPKVTKSLP